MGKIILNNIEYGTGTPNSSNVDTTNLVKKDNIVTVIDENVTDEQIPSAKAVHTAIQNVSVSVPVNTYTKEEVDNLLNTKVDTDDLVDSYSKEEVNNLLDSKADSTDIIDAYNKTEVDNLLANKADSSAIIDSYTKEEVNNLLNDKVDTDDLVDAYSKEEVNNLLADKADSSAIIDAYTKTETDDLLTAKADTTALEQLEDTLTDYPTLEYLEEVKTELENEITNIPKVTKTSELTNDSGFITINDIPEVDLEPYALKTQIPTTLPASDVYDWAKEATKPTYTASEVGALPSNGTAVNASKVSNTLTLQIAGTTKNTFDGSSAQTFNIPNASTSAPGVMTKDMVTKLNGIATGATKNTVDTAMSSTSTNAVQNKVIYTYIQQQIQNQLKNVGDYMGKTMVNVGFTDAPNTSSGYTYTNAKGGFAELTLITQRPGHNSFSLIVDGTTIVSNGVPANVLKPMYDSNNYKYELKIPFTSTFTIKQHLGDSLHAGIQGFIYVNK